MISLTVVGEISQKFRDTYGIGTYYTAFRQVAR